MTVDMGAPDFGSCPRSIRYQWLDPRAPDPGLPVWPLELGGGRSVAIASCRWATRTRCRSVADIDAAPSRRKVR